MKLRISSTMALIIAALFVCCLCSAARAQSSDDDPEDRQFRADVELSYPLRKDLRLIVGADMRTSRFADEGRARGDIGVAYYYRPVRFLTLVPRYRFIAANYFDGANDNQSRLSFDAVVSFPLGRLRVTDSNFIERLVRRNGDYTRYLNRLRVDYPLRRGERQLSLFVRDDVYYDWRRRAWTRNRLRTGVTRQLSELVSADVFYMRQNDGRSGNFHALGIEFEIDFK